MVEQQQQLYGILQGLSSVNKDEREASESCFEKQWMSRPSQVFPALLELVRQCDNQTVRTIGAVMLRKAATRNAKAGEEDVGRLWMQMDGPLQEQCRGALLALFQAEAVEDVQHKLADAIAEVSRMQSEYGSWPELLAVMFSAGTTSGVKSGCLRILAAVPEVVEGLPDFGQVSQLLQASLMDPNGKVRLEALRAAASLAFVYEEEPARVAAALNGIPEHASEILRGFAAEEDLLSEAILSVIEMLETSPKLFRKAYGTLAAFGLGVCRDVEAESEVRSSALELLLTMVEVVKPFRKDKALLDQVVLVLLTLVAEVSDDQAAWCQLEPENAQQQDDEDQQLDGELASYAEQGLDRLAMDLGGAVLVPHLFTHIPQMLQSGDWKMRYAGLRSMAAVTEGCLDKLEDELESVLNLIWPGFSDASPRVQHSASHAFGQLCTDFAGAIQERYAERGLTHLVGLLVSSKEARVQSHAAAALINFAEGVDAAALAPYLDELLTRLVGLLSRPVPYLQSQLMATIAAFSSAAGPAFVRYYEAIVPMLLAALQQQVDPSVKSMRLLQSRALEALTLVFLAVGREHIAQADLSSLLSVMVALQQSSLSDDDEILPFLSSSWVRMCQVLGGADFAQFLPLVIPPLLKEAAAQPDMAVLGLDESTDQYDQAEWEFCTVRGKRLGIRTATLQEKAEAVENLAVYVDTLQAAFLPMAQETLQVVLPLLRFDLHEGVQGAAAEVLAGLLGQMYAADPSGSLPWISQVSLELLASFDEAAFSVEYTYSALDALAELIALDKTCFSTPTWQQALSTALPSLLTCLQESIKEAHDVDEEDEEDGEEDERITNVEDEESLLYALSRFMAALLRQQLASPAVVAGMLDFCSRVIRAKDTFSSSMRHACLCILSDLVHWAAPQAPEQAEAVQRSLMLALKDQDNDVRQTGLFGIGMCADHGGPAYHAFILAMIPPIDMILRNPSSKLPSQLEVTDNAISALARIIMNPAMQAHIQPSHLQDWIAAFPVMADEDEVVPAYSALLALHSHFPVESLRAAIQPALQSSKDLFEAAPELRAKLAALL